MPTSRRSSSDEREMAHPLTGSLLRGLLARCHRTRAFTPAVMLALAGASTGCFHTSQVWPSPLTPGAVVTAKFAAPRTIGLGNDSVIVVAELSGRIVALRADTLVVHLTSVPEEATHASWLGRDATFTLDSQTTVTHTAFDQSSVTLIILAGAVLFYAFLGSLPQ